MKEISDKLYHQLKRLGIIDADTRSHNVGASDYSKHLFQPWTAWIEYNLNAFDADILKRVLRTKEGEDRITDYEKIIHICQERIRQLRFEKEPVPVDYVREEDNQIRKGDMFECIKHLGIGKYLGVGCDDECAYTRGKKYLSEDNGCITCNFGNHISLENLDWWNYFKRIQS